MTGGASATTSGGGGGCGLQLECIAAAAAATPCRRFLGHAEAHIYTPRPQAAARSPPEVGVAKHGTAVRCQPDASRATPTVSVVPAQWGESPNDNEAVGDGTRPQSLSAAVIAMPLGGPNERTRGGAHSATNKCIVAGTLIGLKSRLAAPWTWARRKRRTQRNNKLNSSQNRQQQQEGGSNSGAGTTTEGEEDPGGGVDGVRENFLGLLRYNRLQYFYLGALIFTVINGLIRQTALHAPPLDACGHMPLALQNSNTQPTHHSSGQHATSSGDGFPPFGLLQVVLCALLAFAMALTCSNFNSTQWGASDHWTKPRAWLQCAATLLALGLLLAPLIAVTLAATDGQVVVSAQSAHDYIGQLVIWAALLYALPVALSDSPCTVRALTCVIVASVGATLIIPALLMPPPPSFSEIYTSNGGSGTNQSVKHSINCQAQESSIQPLRGGKVEEEESDCHHQNQFPSGTSPQVSSPSVWPHQSALCLLIAPLLLACGLLRARLLCHFAGNVTFKGANRLIEAKVSLEQQRQQQETLLLSVLPAYVAEQVKRNMVKRITTNLDGEPAQTTGGASLTSTPQNSVPTDHCNRPNQKQHPLVGRSVTLPASSEASATTATITTTTTTCQESSACAVVDRSKPATGGSGALHMRVSLARTARFSSSLASSAAYISETITNKRAHQHDPLQLAQTTITNSSSNNYHHQHSPGPHQLAASLSASAGGHQARRGFNELYIRTYNNVSLLYGDIVGFTRLCTQLSSWQLVRLLNDLFSHFDYLAERHKIMRIKILGDCYYGVAGIPEFAVLGAKSRAAGGLAGMPTSSSSSSTPRPNAGSSASASGVSAECRNHAINCVNMGLDMIAYIKCLNVERATSQANLERGHLLAPPQSQLPTATSSSTCAPQTASVGMSHSLSANNGQQQPMDIIVTQAGGSRGAAGSKSAGSNTPIPQFELNMRIGVHTGHIHSGVIGLKKWQFDVWSNDVSIAMHCESSGVAGRVQVTEATVAHLHGTFKVEPTHSTATSTHNTNTSTASLAETAAAGGGGCSGPSRGPPRDSFLEERDIRTYLICGPKATPAQSNETTKRPNEAEAIDTPSATPLPAGTTTDTPSLAEDKSCRPRVYSRRRKSGGGGGERRAQSERLNETNRIRAATIETIRQTLLAGETANSSALNALALALDHTDLARGLLTFRETHLEQLYSTRRSLRMAAATASVRPLLASLETLLLFLLLVPGLLLFVNFKLAPQVAAAHQLRLLQVASVLIGLLLLVAGLLAVSFSTKTKQTTSAAATTTTKPSSSGRARSPSNSPSNSSQGSQSACLRAQGKWAWPQFIANPRKQRRLRRQWRQRGLALRSLCSLVALIIACGVQLHHLLLRARPVPVASENLNNPTNNHQANQWTMLQIEHHHQLSILLLLAAIDLGAIWLSYRSRSLLLCVTLLIHTALLLVRRLTLACWTANQPHPLFASAEGASGVAEAAASTTWAGHALLLVMGLWSLSCARQLEYASRVNFLWRQRLEVDHEELEYISGINKVLLENILPSHVVQHYLSTQTALVVPQPRTEAPLARSPMGAPAAMGREFTDHSLQYSQHLYHEQHESVAVMFASIPHFYEFYDESNVSKQGLGCIALLNEIICDFDKLLLKNKFSRIEKIKTIGSTYMAVAGLRPSHLASSRNSTSSQASYSSAASPLNATAATDAAAAAAAAAVAAAGQQPNQLGVAADGSASEQSASVLRVHSGGGSARGSGREKTNLVCMIQFATSLMAALNGINKQSFQVFKLRVGVNCGQVIAGIIGAQRPFYDIWGDCVNIASRMESLGQVGRIQVEERTAKLLMECLCTETYAIVKRGPIDVKGKGGMVTYFVDQQKRPTATPTTAALGSGKRGNDNGTAAVAAASHRGATSVDNC